MNISNRRVGIALPLTWTHVPIQFFDSWNQMVKPDCLYLRHANGALDALRNNLVEDALANRCSHIILMDTDQIYPVDTIPSLIRHNLPIVGGLVHRRYPPFDPLIFRGELDHWVRIDDYEEGDLVEIDATGTGCLMIQTWVFEKIKRPWFKFGNTSSGTAVGEDIYFCVKAREAGIPIFVDTSVQIGHLATLNVTRQTYETYCTVHEDMLKRGNDEDNF